MIALVDTNVVLDVMLGRKPHLAESAAVLAAVETGRCQGVLCATTVTTLHYLARRHLGTQASLDRTADLLTIFGVAPVNQAVLGSAITSRFPDFEDGVLHEAARLGGADCIVTRNTHDFRAASIPVYSPAQFMVALENEAAG